MRKGFDDTRVREAGLGRNPIYRTLSSIEFCVFVMFLIGVATLIAALFPQGMDQPFYIARFGEKLHHVYDSLGLLSVLHSWWFMLLFMLLLAALILCTHARVREGMPRGTRGTRLYETEFSIPTATEDVLLIFPVLLSSIGFRKRRIITGEGHWEILAERGIHPSVSSLLVHASAAILLLGLVLTYVFSWGCSLTLEAGKPLVVPFQCGQSRWATFTGEQSPNRPDSNERDSLRIGLLKLTRYYEPAPRALPETKESVLASHDPIPREEVFVRKDGKSLVLKGWSSRLSLASGTRVDTVDVFAGKTKMAMGLRFYQGPISKTARIAFPALRETIQVSLPTNLRFEAAQVASVPSLVPIVGQMFRLESSGTPGNRAVRIRILPSGAKTDKRDATRQSVVDLGVGEETQLAGLSMKVVQLSDWSLIRARSDPGGRIVKLGAFFVLLFTMFRLYVYCYVLRAEISGAKAGPSHLSLRIRTSGLLASPSGVARKIAGLLAK
jgi:hypothetical protein